jgi:hypothetical protein
MRSKIVVCLLALVLASVSGAFAAPELASAPAVAQPMPVEDFVQALGNIDPSEPIDKIVLSCAGCSSNLQCFSICGPAFCGGTCRFVSSCNRKVCDCLQCP